MDLRTQLATRFHIENIRELLHYIKEDERLREEIYRLIFDEDDIVSYQALWVCTHFSKPEVEWLTLKQDELIDAALTCPHSGTGTTGSRYSFSEKKHIESYQSKEKERTSELIIYSDEISGIYL